MKKRHNFSRRTIFFSFKHSLLIIILTYLFKFIILVLNIYLINSYNLKICLCTLGKNENKYAIEFVEHYKKYGIDKIFIYDNNEIEGEKFENILSEYIKSNFIELIDFRGEKKIQLKILNHCYKNNYKKYDWLILFDMDEFIYLKNHRKIKNFLINKQFKDCKIIYLNELIHLDSNKIYYENKTLSERFKSVDFNTSKLMVKSIIRGNLDNINITNNHIIDLKISMKTCNGNGQRPILKGIHLLNPDIKNYYFDHYYYKSCEEYLEKLKRGSCFWGNSRAINLLWLTHFFDRNKITIEKINYSKTLSNSEK